MYKHIQKPIWSIDRYVSFLTTKGDETWNGFTRRRERSKLPESLSLKLGLLVWWTSWLLLGSCLRNWSWNHHFPLVVQKPLHASTRTQFESLKRKKEFSKVQPKGIAEWFEWLNLLSFKGWNLMAKNWSLHVRFGEIGEAWIMMMIMPWEGEGKKNENINVLKQKGGLLMLLFWPREKARGRRKVCFKTLLLQEMKIRKWMYCTQFKLK
jgi:hypothetical protein